jgi:hypothetical protein
LGTPATSATAGQNYTFTPTASDANGDRLTFSAANLPSWATFDTATGTVSGTAAAGAFRDITISVSDGQATSTLPPFRIDVQAASPTNSPPTISGNPSTLATAGQSYSFRPTASDPDGDALTFSIAGRPSWATFSTTTGRLSGTPGAADVMTYSGIVISVSDGTISRSLAAFSIAVSTSVPTNTPPTISGAPLSIALQGRVYAFAPIATDADGDTLTFGVANKPSWASFDASSGQLSGTPTVGNYSGIAITVSDGQSSATLGPFSIDVVATATGTATLTWTAPTTNSDGSPLTDLAGYRLYWGTTSGVYTDSVTLSNPGLTTYVVDQLTPAKWYFAAKTLNGANAESAFSNEATKTVP